MSKMLSTDSSGREILAWIDESLTDLFPEHSHWPVRRFCWMRHDSLDRWAGMYLADTLSIQLDPDFFRGISDPALQDKAICDILLHELCHHVQCFIDPTAPSHGKLFRELAFYVNGKLKRDAVTIYHSLAKTPEGQEAERAQRKALALLARTTSSNEHEAALAAAKYAEFTALNNIVLDSHGQALADGLPVMTKEHVWTTRRYTRGLRGIINEVAYSFACYVTYTQTNGITKVSLYGRPVRIHQAYNMIEYLVGAVDRVVKEQQRKDKRDGTKRARNFWPAFREGVALRAAQHVLEDHQRRLAEGVTPSSGIAHVPGLVLKSSFEKEYAAATDLVNRLHPRLARASAPRGASNHWGLQAGVAAGAGISVARQATGSAQLALTAG